MDYFKFWSDIGHHCISLGLPFAIKTFLSVTMTTLVLPLVIGTLQLLLAWVQHMQKMEFLAGSIHQTQHIEKDKIQCTRLIFEHFKGNMNIHNREIDGYTNAMLSNF